MSSILVNLETSHLERSPLNDDAEANMPSALATLDTSHFEMSPLNLFTPGTISLLNNAVMSITAETSQDPIGPCRLLEQLVGVNSRHSLIAGLSSALDFGAHAVVEY